MFFVNVWEPLDAVMIQDRTKCSKTFRSWKTAHKIFGEPRKHSVLKAPYDWSCQACHVDWAC